MIKMFDFVRFSISVYFNLCLRVPSKLVSFYNYINSERSVTKKISLQTEIVIGSKLFDVTKD